MSDISTHPGFQSAAAIAPAAPQRAHFSAQKTPTQLRTLAIFAPVRETALDVLARHGQTLALRRRGLLALGPEHDSQAIFVWSGACRALSVSPNGEALCLASIRSGEPIDIAHALAGAPRLPGMRIVADEASQLLLIPAPALAEASALCGVLSANLLQAVARAHIATAWRLFESRALDLRSRLIGEILRMGERGALEHGAIIIETPPTQRDLATRIGAAREGVARHLQTLESEGLLRREPKRLKLVAVRRLVEEYYHATGRVFEAYAPMGRLAGPSLTQSAILQKRGRDPGQ